MADNYIEKQMEALRQGRLHIKAKPGIQPKAKRILIAGGTKGPALEKALQYRKDGHRVAIFDEDTEAGKRLAHDHAIRFHRVSLYDKTTLTRELHSLLTAWRGIDMMIGSEAVCSQFERIVRDWKENLPIKDTSETTLIIL